MNGWGLGVFCWSGFGELKMVFGVMVMCYVTSGEMCNGIG